MSTAPLTSRICGRARLIYSGAARYRGAVELGWYDFLTMFRRSFLGPLWAPAQLALWIATITIIFNRTLGDSVGSYALYVGIGMVAWELILSVLVEGPRHLSAQSSLIKNVRVDLSYLSVRKVSLLLFRSAFQAPIAIILIILFGTGLTWTVLLLIPAIFIYILTAYALVVILGFVGVYFRDFEFLMPSVGRFLFFVTPIFWYGDAGVRKIISTYNPFTYYIEIIREPLMGGAPSPLAWIVVGAITVTSFVVALWTQSNFRRSAIYWM